VGRSRTLPGAGSARVPAALPDSPHLAADEANFAKEKRARFLARAATSHWDAIIITHSAFRFIAVPAAESIKDRRDDMVTIEEIGIDQIVVDEARSSASSPSPRTAST